ncbi:metalloprotease 1 [Beauveria brongniartii RCEF 3172]|uniref:Metalloprotease 1 n=1 Tax=Beauveria brongniartii RCEF 3172 TaxID=1081107 RepID=A0A162JTG8_9HYPO|nr:metalloprotease 1 [Beauveria brongniartii RCEF 3172]
MRSTIFSCFLGLLARGALVAALRPAGQDGVTPREPEEMDNPPEELLAIHRKLHDAGLASGQVRRDSGNGLPDLGDTVNTPINFEVYVHVVTGTQEGQDRASDSIIQKQIDVLNDAFQGNFTITRKGTDRTVNSVWAAGDDVKKMRDSLYKGDESTWNLYLLDVVKGRSGKAALGVSSSPIFAGRSSDSSLIDIDTLPGGSESGYNLGKTAVHECGHWLGLVHTFLGGCDGFGDYVDDTPPEESASKSCNPRDSCPHKPGLDPINNYMNYSPDSCLTEFMPGQYIRARQLWAMFRAKDVPAPSASTTIQQTATPSASI